MNSKVLFPVLALAIAGLVVWAVFLRGGDPDRPGEQTSPSANGAAAGAAAGAQEIEPRSVDAPLTVDVDEVPADERLQMPDGTWLRTLNGVKNPAELSWPSDRPYSPVVRIETHVDGLQWYHHADGSQHTTMPQWRKDLGRMDSTTVLGNPTETVPMLPGESPGPRLPEGGR